MSRCDHTIYCINKNILVSGGNHDSIYELESIQVIVRSLFFNHNSIDVYFCRDRSCLNRTYMAQILNYDRITESLNSPIRFNVDKHGTARSHLRTTVYNYSIVKFNCSGNVSSTRGKDVVGIWDSTCGSLEFLCWKSCPSIYRHLLRHLSPDK